MAESAGNPSRRQIVAALEGQLRDLETARRRPSDDRISSGYNRLDEIIPHRGFAPGTLVEWFSAGDGAGATTLAVSTAQQACRSPEDSGRVLVVVDRRGEFFPPAAALAGIDLEQTVVVRPRTGADEIWAIDQALRCAGVAAVLAWPDELDDRAFRRLQLAAEAGGGLGLLVRPGEARHQASWAEVRLLVEPLPVAAGGRRLRVELLRCRGGPGSGPVELELDDETRLVHLAAPLAPAAPLRRSASAS